MKLPLPWKEKPALAAFLVLCVALLAYGPGWLKELRAGEPPPIFKWEPKAPPKKTADEGGAITQEKKEPGGAQPQDRIDEKPIATCGSDIPSLPRSADMKNDRMLQCVIITCYGNQGASIAFADKMRTLVLRSRKEACGSVTELIQSFPQLAEIADLTRRDACRNWQLQIVDILEAKWKDCGPK